MNYTEQEIQKINRLIAEKIEGMTQPHGREMWYLRGKPDQWFSNPPNYESPADLLRAVEKVTESKSWTFYLADVALVEHEVECVDDGIRGTTDETIGKAAGPGRITKALYSALAQYVLSLDKSES